MMMTMTTMMTTMMMMIMKEDGFQAAHRFVGFVSVTQISRSHYVKENCKTVRN
jgi:hypothetical protein